MTTTTSGAISAPRWKKAAHRVLSVVFILILWNAALALIFLNDTKGSSNGLQFFQASISEYFSNTKLIIQKTVVLKKETAPFYQPQPLQSSPSLLGPRPVPRMDNKAGGIILFYHVAKAGGTTIRTHLQSFSNVQVQGRTDVTKFLPEIKMHAKGYRPGQILALELHDGPNPTLPELAAILEPVRMEAAANHVPFFAFTTLREPLSYAVSYYNYENLGQSHRYIRGNSTEASFKRLTLPNPQCMFLVRGELATTKIYPELGYNLTTKECASLYEDTMTRHLDWIGTMETMSTETLPLLSYMISGNVNPTIPGKENVKRKRLDHIQKDHLTNDTVDYIYSISQGDSLLRNNIARDYPFSMWTDFHDKQ